MKTTIGKLKKLIKEEMGGPDPNDDDEDDLSSDAEEVADKTLSKVLAACGPSAYEDEETAHDNASDGEIYKIVEVPDGGAHEAVASVLGPPTKVINRGDGVTIHNWHTPEGALVVASDDNVDIFVKFNRTVRRF